MYDWRSVGFSLSAEAPLPELEATMYRLTHDKTGLELVWLKRDEENKTFAIAFETLPHDDTGVFHILEHSVLCGSEKYPVKEPFVELLKSSMNTFLNALTFQDKTMYPVASRNSKDFINLVRVYLDAVFRPLIYTKPEIFYQEGWHYEPDENGNVSYKGVVFNEMKGAFASADELVVDKLNRLLFPQSPYRFVSGGDPASIPDLTYEAFLDDHRRFYAPSNAYVFLDGDMDILQVLGILHNEYLCHYEKTERMAPPPMQLPVSGEAEGFYELAPGEKPEGKVRFSTGKVVGTFDDRERLIAAELLCNLLCGSNQSPLTRALLSEGLAEEVSMWLNDGMLQPWLVLDVKNLREEELPRVRAAITAKLEELATNGLDHEQLEAVMANAEFKLRERDYGYYPQGLVFGFSALESWLYGGDPAANLQVGNLFVRLKQKMHEGYFEQLLRELLLDNPHSACVVLRPSHELGQERRAKEQARLDREVAAWTPDDRREIQARQDRLTAWQESQDTPEALATIPQLSLSDLPPRPEEISTEVMQCGTIPVLTHALHTGGVVYVSLYFDAGCCTPEEFSCLSFACDLLGSSDAGEYTAEQIINRSRLLCGNLSIQPVSYLIGDDPQHFTTRLRVSFSTLESNLSEATAHVAQILTQSRFREESAHDILRQTKMDVFQRAVMAGNAMGMTRVLAQSSPLYVIEDYTGGISFYNWLKSNDDAWDFAALNERMQALLTRIVRRGGMTVSASGISTERAAALTDQLAALIPDAPCPAPISIRPWGHRREGIVIPADISFAVRGGELGDIASRSYGALQLAGQIISLAYLWNVIRVQGGAYGTGLRLGRGGLMACYSYRDPGGASSLEQYTHCGEFLRQLVQSGQELTGFIIGAVANASPLMTPRTKATVADGRYFSQSTAEERCRDYRRMIEATPQDLLDAADALEQTIRDGGICLVGGQAQLESCDLLEQIITL